MEGVGHLHFVPLEDLGVKNTPVYLHQIKELGVKFGLRFCNPVAALYLLKAQFPFGPRYNFVTLASDPFDLSGDQVVISVQRKMKSKNLLPVAVNKIAPWYGCNTFVFCS